MTEDADLKELLEVGYQIDPAWPVLRRPEMDEVDLSEVPDCEVCWARAATKLVDLWGVEGWACGYCR